MYCVLRHSALIFLQYYAKVSGFFSSLFFRVRKIERHKCIYTMQNYTNALNTDYYELSVFNFSSFYFCQLYHLFNTSVLLILHPATAVPTDIIFPFIETFKYKQTTTQTHLSCLSPQVHLND